MHLYYSTLCPSPLEEDLAFLLSGDYQSVETYQSVQRESLEPRLQRNSDFLNH